MYDVIIAGAGPAGSTCARICARQGLKTLLLDKDIFPRSKPCGGAVSELALSHLDFPIPGELVEQECFNVRVHCLGRVVEVRHDCRFCITVTRRDFDAFLADKAREAGTLFRPGERVFSVHDKPDSVEVITETTSYEGRFLVGADGIHSRVARAVRPSLAYNEMALALVAQTSADDREIDQRMSKTLDLYFGEAPVGYGWIFPHRNYYSAGIAGLASRFSKPRQALADFAERLSVSIIAMQGHFIPFGGIKRTIARGRILLAGDAAGFADPFHGEGIAYAILSGKLAAQAIAEAVKAGRSPLSVAARYSRNADQQIRRQLKVALRMARMLDNYPRLFLGIFFDHPEVLRRYLDIPAGRMSYRGFQKWILARVPFLLLPRARKKDRQPD